MRRITAGRLDAPLMLISIGRQAIVAGPAIGRYYRAYRHDVLNKADQALSCDIMDLPETYPAEPFGRVNLNGYDDYGFRLCSSATNTLFLSTNVRLVNLNMSTEHVPTRTNHGTGQLVQPSPCGLIAAQSEHSLQAQRAYAELLVSEMIVIIEKSPTRGRNDHRKVPHPIDDFR